MYGYYDIMTTMSLCLFLFSLKKAIAFHRQKRKEDSNNAMTVVLKNVQKTAGAKPILDDLIVAMDRGKYILIPMNESYHIIFGIHTCVSSPY